VHFKVVGILKADSKQMCWFAEYGLVRKVNFPKYYVAYQSISYNHRLEEWLWQKSLQ